MSRSPGSNSLSRLFHRPSRLALVSTTRCTSRISSTSPSLTGARRRSPCSNMRHYATESGVPTRPGQYRRKNPVLTTLLLLTTFAAGSFTALKVYDRYYGNKSAFPLEVEDKLRQAIYHSEIVNEPALSYREFQEALEIADAIGIDQWSDPYLGIKIRMTEMLEKHGMHSEAIGLYSELGFEFQMYHLKEMVKLGLIAADTWEKLPPEVQSCQAKEASDILSQSEKHPALIAVMDEASKSILSEKKGDFSRDSPSDQARRQRVYRLWMGSLQNLALYMMRVGDFNKAIEMFQSILWYDNVLSHQMLPFYDAKEALLTYQEKAAIWSNNGSACFYSGTRATEAIQCWDRALHIFRDLNGDQPTCEEVTMLSSIGLARSDVSGTYGVDISRIPTTSSPSSHSPTPAEVLRIIEASEGSSISPLSAAEIQKEKDEAINEARKYVMTAYKLSKTIQPPIRTAECDEGCLSATMNLATFAEEVGNFTLAKERVLEAKGMAEQILSSRTTHPTGAEPQSGDNGNGETLGKVGVLETALRTLRGGGRVRGQTAEEDGNTGGGHSIASDMAGLTMSRYIDECDYRLKRLDEKIAG